MVDFCLTRTFRQLAESVLGIQANRAFVGNGLHGHTQSIPARDPLCKIVTTSGLMPNLTPEERQKIYFEEKARLEKNTSAASPSRTGIKLAIAIALVGLGYLVLSRIGNNGSTLSPQPIKYRVSGTAFSVDITYANETNGTTHVKKSGGRQSEGGISIFWETTLTLQKGVNPYLSAQNQEGDGTIIAEILTPDGDLIKRSESTGEYGVATVFQ